VCVQEQGRLAEADHVTVGMIAITRASGDRVREGRGHMTLGTSPHLSLARLV
jgi:hypothetical protein